MTVSTTTASQSASVHQMPRRTPVPATEPAYDDERGDRGATVMPTQGTLALDLAPATAPSVDEPPRRRHLRLVEEPAHADREDPFFARQRTPSAALPDPKSWSGRYVQSLVEVLSGDRPVAQLLRWTHETVYSEVQHHVRMLTRSMPVANRGRGRRNPSRVQSVHVCEPSDGIVEASVHVRHGNRSRAVALRLEGLDGRWRCTALQFG